MKLRTAMMAGLAVMAGIVGPVVVGATPASAALPGTVRVEQPSLTNSFDKSATVSCPGTTRVINAGAYLTNGDLSVTIDEIVPDVALTSVTVTARETDPTLANWTVTAVATCTTAPAGLERNVVTSLATSVDKSATATCTGNRTLLGTGSEIVGGSGNVLLDETKPNGVFGAASTGATVWAYEDDPAFASTWKVVAYAICADPLPGQQTLWTVGDWNSAGKTLTAACPGGQVATGGGIEIGTTTDEGEILVSAVHPNGSPTVAPTKTVVKAVEEDPVANSWGIMAFVLCVDA